MLLLWCYFAKSAKVKRRLGIAAIAIFLFFSNPFILTRLVNAWQPEPVQLAASAHYSAGIVLGGYASFDRNGRGLFNNASDRFIQTCRLYKLGHIQKILVTGSTIREGQPEEADFVQKQLIVLGVPPQDILVEDSSRNTFENAVFSKRLLGLSGLRPPYLLITSALHVPRAMSVFKKAGLMVVAYPANYTVRDKRISFLDVILPDAGVLEQWEFFIKEIVGIAAYRLTNKI